MACAELVLPRIEGLPGPLALRLDVGLPTSVHLLDTHDLDNYLYPLAARLSRLAGRPFATVWGTKAHRHHSFIQVETATEDDRSRPGATLAWITLDTAAQSQEFKKHIRDQLTGVPTLPEGPVNLDLAFKLGRTRNWINLWKPTIDALDPILGRTRPDRDWHPRDGRVVELALHRDSRPDSGKHITVALEANLHHPPG
jgi:hypothetical protein